MFLIANSIVVVSKVQKQSVSNAFQYVVLHPSAPSYSKDIIAATGRCKCKDTKKFVNKVSITKKSAKKSKKFGR